MFRIRAIYDDALPINRAAIEQVQAILRAQFPQLREQTIRGIPERLRNPLKYRFRAMLLVGEGSRGGVKGFALLFHDPELRFCYLDFVAAAQHLSGRGIGGALYERVRQEALRLDVVGILFECLPDDPTLCRDPAILKQNAARLRFYERYGARPIVGTIYETPLKPEDDNPPYLVFDDLGQGVSLQRDHARAIVRAILEREYGHLCTPAYIDRVVDSFQDPVVKLREPRYARVPPSSVAVGMVAAADAARVDAGALSGASRRPAAGAVDGDRSIALVINDRHEIHHVRERGYVEAPIRINSILKELMSARDPAAVPFTVLAPRHYAETHILAVHDAAFVRYLKTVCRELPENRAVYPYVFPIRNATRPPEDLSVRAGYYCIDTFTPLSRNAYAAARRAVDCALTAADELLLGRHIAYALVRPPGHHAERRVFGGFCYFNSAAIAAHYLCTHGKTAILDIDYHHGNGQQDIFYERSDVLTVSIHGHPRFAYPYFSGFSDERGEGLGRGFNVNLPLGESVDGPRYREALDSALNRITAFKPRFLVVALGLDTAKGDPTGTWSLKAEDFEANGKRIAAAAAAITTPILVVQEGGYNNRNIGVNARRFFEGLWRENGYTVR